MGLHVSFPPRSRRWLVWVALVGVLGAAVVKPGCDAYRFERRLAFVPHRLGGVTAEGSGLAKAVEVEYGRSSGSPLRGWYVPSGNGAAILFVHGAGGDRRSLVREAALLQSDGFGVLLIDLPGLGESGGRITGGRTEEAAIASAVGWLEGQGTGNRPRIGALSFSLGSHFLTRVAASDPRLRAVALEAPSTSILDRIRASHRRRGWLAALPATLAFFEEGTNPWRNQARDAVGAIAPRPVLLITGSRDEIATPAMAQELFARAGAGARLEIFDTGHGGYWEADSPRYATLLRSFFAAALAP